MNDPIQELLRQLTEATGGERPGSDEQAVKAYRTELEARARELAEPTIKALRDITDLEERLPRLTAAVDDAAGKVSEYAAQRNVALTVLVSPRSIGGDQCKKVHAAAKALVTRGYVHKVTDVTGNTVTTAKRNLRKAGFGSASEAVMSAAAHVLYYGELREELTRLRIDTVKALAAGEFKGKVYAQHEIAALGNMDSALVTYCTKWSGEGARKSRRNAAAVKPLSEAARNALLAAPPDGVLSNRGENPIRLNTLTGMVNNNLAEWGPNVPAQDEEETEGRTVILTAEGRRLRDELLSEAA